MNENITKEKIDEIIEQASYQLTDDITQRYVSWIDQLGDEIENTAKREVMAVAFTQTNMLLALKDILYKLFTD